MKQLADEIFENGIRYQLVGDYYLPDIRLREESRPIGKFGMMRKEYLKNHRHGQFSLLVLQDRLDKHLADVQEEAEQMFESLVWSMAEEEKITEKMKRSDQLRWVRQQNNIRCRAEEIVRERIIYR